MSEILKIENLEAGYIKNNPIIKNINFEIDEQEVIAIIGKNGAGKSTFARAIMNLLPFKSGNILFNRKAIEKLSTNEISHQGIAYFIQGGSVFKNLTVLENISFACSDITEGVKNERIKQLEPFFSILKTSKNGKTNLRASYLSGGEQQELALLMVLLKNPQLIILDEPSAGLSPKNTINIYNIIQRLITELNKTIILIEQNINLAFQVADKITIFKNGEISDQLLKKDTELEYLQKYYFSL